MHNSLSTIFPTIYGKFSYSMMTRGSSFLDSGTLGTVNLLHFVVIQVDLCTISMNEY